MINLKQNTMTNYDVVKKIIGDVTPIGESTTDAKRFENLKAMTELVDALITEISHVSKNKIAYEYSVKRAGEFAYNFLKDTKEGIE